MGVSGSYIASPSQVGAGVAWTKITETTLTGTASSVSFTGLNLETDKEYIIEVYQKGGAAGAGLRMQFNGDTTATNYYSNRGYFSTSAGTSRTNTNLCFLQNSNQLAFATIHICKIASNKPVWLTEEVHDAGSTGVSMEKVGGNWETTDNITSITLACENANNMLAGSIYKLYKAT